MRLFEIVIVHIICTDYETKAFLTSAKHPRGKTMTIIKIVPKMLTKLFISNCRNRVLVEIQLDFAKCNLMKFNNSVI